MKLNDILQLDFRNKEDRITLRKALVRLPFFQEQDPREITFEDLEKALNKMCKKYPIMLAYIMFSKVDDDERYYSLMIKHSETNEWLKTVYAISMFEGYGKAVIFMYSYIKNNLKKGS